MNLSNWAQWWKLKFGANWRRPYGPRSSISGLDDHPVVHIAYRDAEATPSGWAKNCRRKPSGNLPRTAASKVRSLPGAASSCQTANTWQGNFPHENLKADGYERTSPVMAFPPNGYGVYDMIGNVWEWTIDWYSPKHEADAPKARCIPENPRGAPEAASYDPCQPIGGARERVLL